MREPGGTPFGLCPKSDSPKDGPSKKNGSKTPQKAVPEEGIEGAQILEVVDVCGDSGTEEAPRVDVSARELVAFGPNDLVVENALARAIDGAVGAQRWDIVAQLARDLEARRLARSNAAQVARPLDRRRR